MTILNREQRVAQLIDLVIKEGELSENEARTFRDDAAFFKYGIEDLKELLEKF